MSKNLPISVDIFSRLVDPKCNYLFADKTLFIKEILDDMSGVTLITRPRRWGKTLNLSMLEHFLAPKVHRQSTKGLFDAYAIAQVDGGRYIRDHQGQYPVISISFKDIKESTFSMALEKMKGLIQYLCRAYDYLVDSPQLSDADKALFSKYLTDAPTQAELEDSLKKYQRIVE